MANKIKYSFDDFTLKNYEDLIKVAKTKFAFCKYEEENNPKNSIFWRHDVDCSLDYSLNLAQIEHRHEVTSTYFILLHSDFYNPLEHQSLKILEEIISLGHQIGLHFDASFFNCSNESDLEKYLNLEKKYIENILNIEIKVFSFHNSTELELSWNNHKYSNCINTYANIFKKDYPYCSDSNGYWRHKRLEDFLRDPTITQAQVLTHPEWWQEKVRSPKERIEMIAEKRSKDTINNYTKILNAHGRSNIDW